MTTPALPVMPQLVECAPYRTRLLPRACAERWEIARTLERTKRTKNAEKSGPTYDRQRVEKCVGCPVGERRAAELGGVPKMTPIHDARGTSWKKKRSPPVKPPVIRPSNAAFEQRIDRESAIPAAHPQAGVMAAAKEERVKTIEKRECTNPECGKPFKPARVTSSTCSKKCYQRWAYLKKTGAVKSTRGDVFTSGRYFEIEEAPPAPKPTSPFLLWVQLQDRVDERKRIAAESIAAAEADLARFEEEHPDVVVIGTQRLERALAVRSARDTTKPTTPTPPDPGSAAAPLASGDSEE